MAAIPGVSRHDFSRFFELTLDPSRPDITMIARPIDMTDPRNTLPIIGETVAPALLSDDAIPVWVSEAMVDLYDYTVGKQVSLPLGAVGNDAQSFFVAGVWRDYGRQFAGRYLGGVVPPVAQSQSIEPGWLTAPNYHVNGELELRGVSADLEFDATVALIDNGSLAMETHFDIDRTCWNVIYGSTRFFEHLGMHKVFDLLSFQIRMIAVR